MINADKYTSSELYKKLKDKPKIRFRMTSDFFNRKYMIGGMLEVYKCEFNYNGLGEPVYFVTEESYQQIMSDNFDNPRLKDVAGIWITKKDVFTRKTKLERILGYDS